MRYLVKARETKLVSTEHDSLETARTEALRKATINNKEYYVEIYYEVGKAIPPAVAARWAVA